MGVALRVLEIRQTQTTKLACPEELRGSVSIRVGLLNVELGHQFHLCDSAERVHVEHVLLKVAVVEGFVESTHVFARLLDFFFHEFGQDSCCWWGRAGCGGAGCCGAGCCGGRCCRGITVKCC